MTLDDDLDRRWRALRDLTEAASDQLEGLELLPSHIQAAATLIQRLDEQSPGRSPSERESDLLTAEALWTLVSRVWSQRALLGRRSEALHLLDAVCNDSFTRLRSSALHLGAREKGPARWPTPLVVLEPMSTPAILVRGKHSRGATLLGGHRTFGVPFPIVLFPPDQLACPWVWATAHHEVGHEIDTAFGITEELRPVIAMALPTQSGARIQEWEAWTRELVADVFALFSTGPSYGDVLRYVLRAGGRDPEVGADTHPPLSVRLAVLEQVAHRWAGTSRSPVPADPVGGPRAENIAAIAKALVETRLPTLRGGTLLDLAEPAAEVESALADGGVLHHRHLPSVAWLAHTARNEPDDILKMLLDLDREIGPSVRPTRPDTIEFLTRDLPTMRATLREEPFTTRKVPPLELFARSRAVAFVGATNDGLPGLFRRHIAREGSRLDHLEIYFLVDRALAGLSHDGASAADLVASRDAAIRDIVPLLEGVARHAELRWYDQPFFFASYWDWDGEAGRIHVSPAIWDQDVKHSPSIDYVSGDGYAYERYRLGLEGLRRRSVALDLHGPRPIPVPSVIPGGR